MSNKSKPKWTRRKRPTPKPETKPAVQGAGQTHKGLPYFTLDKGIEQLLDHDPDVLRSLPDSSRIRLACKLKIAGATYEQIAEKLGYKRPAYAKTAIRRAMNKLYELTPEDLEQLVKLDLARLDAMQLVYWEKATRYGDEKAGKLILEIMEKRRQLLNIESSNKGGVNIHVSGQTQMLVVGGDEDEFIERLREIRGDDSPTYAAIEAAQEQQDIQDAEIVEDDNE